MDRAIYTAMSAANASLNRQAVTSNNLANSSTAGFRAQLAAFRAVPVAGESLNTRALVAESTPFHDESMGPITHTGRNLDVALPQNGWLAVEMPDGSEAYTRNGTIEVDNQGALSVGGRPLMGDGAALTVPPQSEVTIGADGTISALGGGDDATALVQVGRLKMVNAEMSSLLHGDDGLFRSAAAGALAQDEQLRLSPEALEGSNVSPVKAMAEMIANSRGFDMNMKVIRTADENAQKANQLLSVG
ncbi:flagellar basal body rod protein FlgF [Candidatus Pantoea floridensis]|jgi:flagellar basal-body rod protein FlgF|uniref:Flagellar basal-body rod protein FlgF n=1 Tax=Candidatus Pantoea floridensis TaxID=1938870 RepID=A0A286BXT6_9GAMM|nr:flagellar basal body rod protein FlgF [Pantoea floridensis]PIF21459.1 flagellar basal-body rod protein FlgF [Enterobacteriaceae bacterium JKS000233]SOD38971.1 flagellar basal-body rod protein FlgF [Pantoea floridensis]